MKNAQHDAFSERGTKIRADAMTLNPVVPKVANLKID